MRKWQKVMTGARVPRATLYLDYVIRLDFIEAAEFGARSERWPPGRPA